MTSEVESEPVVTAVDLVAPVVRISTDERLHQIIDRTVAFAALLAPDGVFKDVSQNALDAGGLTRAEVIGRPFWETYWWTHDASVRDRVRLAVQAAQAGQTIRYDAEVRIINDGRLHIDFQVSPILNREGEVAELVASAFDISDRVAAHSRMEAFLREMSHRIKNLLATVRAMARLSQRTAPPEVAFKDFVGRLTALSAAHDALDRSHTADAFFANYAQEILAPYTPSKGTRVSITGPEIRLARDTAKMLGLCIYELATNAIKYGALANDAGRVTLVLTEPDADGVAAFLWTEKGGPLVQSPQQVGYGTQFLTTTLQAIFGNPVQIDYRPDGLSLRVSGQPTGLFAPVAEAT